MRHALCSPVLIGLVLAACADGAPFEPASPDALAAARAATASAEMAPRIVAMTRNIYIGADVDQVITALNDGDPNNDFDALLEAIATLRATDFVARAAALADEIARHRPHVVGLQEVEELDIEIPPAGIDIELDFLAILEAALAARGLNYDAVAQVDNTTVTLTPVPGVTVALVDGDVMLVDADRVEDVTVLAQQNFENNIGVVAPGVNLIRGWVAIRATIEGVGVTVANTHLEAGNSPPSLSLLRAAQAMELVTSLGGAAPAILLGDLNDAVGSPMYQVVTGAGFVDAWGALPPGTAALTCCHASDLSNPVAAGEFDQRIDYVLARGFGRAPGRVAIVGSTPDDKVAGPLYPIWPSDHAGVVAELPLPLALSFAP